MADSDLKGADALLRDVFLAFVRVHLLHHAAEAPIYGAEMIEELARHGYQIGPGTMYPTLHGLRARGYLDEERRELLRGGARAGGGLVLRSEEGLKPRPVKW